MPPDQTAAHSDDRCRYCQTLTVSAQPNGQCDRVRISLRRSTKLSSIRAIRHRLGGRPHDPPWTLAPHIFLLHVVAEGAGS
jgi:hypothetical protein